MGKGTPDMRTGKQNKNLILSLHLPQVHQYQQTEPSMPIAWKVLIVVILVLHIFLSFGNLDQNPDNADEVRGFDRIAGYTINTY